ncbi:hypothetical protein K0038_00185 [Pseudomonas syringae]|uniref:hypothetical protein n=1 Tax=Pseudomonas syringae group TaxID=136849 RepID=UPI0013CF0D21|nr:MULTISPECIES: hypothetical protein [Pseudomonas syringae group]MCI3943197.1 hypothetical protein [Pseudomonas syringae]
MSLKQISHQLEHLCQVEKLFLLENQTISRRVLYPVITEHAKSDLNIGSPGQYEFFRARTKSNEEPDADFHPWWNSISVTVCHTTRAVKFGPTGQLIMHPQNIRLGPNLMACVIKWLEHQDIANYTVENGLLSWRDAETDAARLQRNKFYTAFGFDLVGNSGTQHGLEVVDGTFGAATVGALIIPDRYQTGLVPWDKFACALETEREEGVRNLAELKEVDRFTDRKSFFGKWLLKLWGWRMPFETRHKHPLKDWEPSNAVKE